MLDENELTELLIEMESGRVERKKSVSDTVKISQAICAFANDMPGHGEAGVVFVGVNDDGSCANLRIDDQLLLTLASLRSDGKILPLPSMVVQKRTLQGRDLVVLIVEPSLFPPVRYEGRIWIRVGPRRALASEAEERRLNERRRYQHLPWDLQPLAPAELRDLDVDLFQRTYLPSAIASDVLEQNHRSLEQQLTSLRFVSVDESMPTVVGLLTIGKSPADYIPGAYVQFLRIDGKLHSDPILDQGWDTNSSRQSS